MKSPDDDVVPRTEDPDAALERAHVQEFLRRHGHDWESLRGLPPADRDRLLRQARTYAAGKLAEVEAKAHLLEELDNPD